MDQEELLYLRENCIEVIDIIGQGSSGLIFYVYSIRYKMYFALKKITEMMFNKSEIDSLLALDDERIVRLYKCYQFGGFIYLLMEYCPYDIYKLTADQTLCSNPETLQRLVAELVYAVKSCHSKNIAHCDIKPSNFLVDEYGRVKITDFGLATECPKDNPFCSLRSGTMPFMAPELFGMDDYNPLASDIWSLGVTIYNIVTGKYPFSSDDDITFVSQIEMGVYNSDLIRDPYLRNLIERCLVVDPTKRATIDELVSHPYFTVQVQKHVKKKNDIIIKPVAHSANNVKNVRYTLKSQKPCINSVRITRSTSIC